MNHSVYDSFTWFTRFGDPDLAYGRALSQVTTTMTMRLADAAIVPYQFDDLARTAKGYIDQVQKEFPAVDLREPSKEWWRLAQAARAFNAEYPAALKRAATSSSPEKVAKINALLYGTERALAPQASGLPGRNWYKHLLYAPGLYTGYGARTLPALRESLDAGRLDEARERGKDIAKALRDCAAKVEEAVALMRKL